MNHCIAIILLSLLCLTPPFAAHRSRKPKAVAENGAFRLEASFADGQVTIRLDDKRSGLLAADGPCIYRAVAAGHAARLTDPSIAAEPDAVVIRGMLLGFQVEHRFTLPKGTLSMEERVTLRNPGRSIAGLTDLEVGMTRRATPDIEQDRWIAVPLRIRATDPPGRINEVSVRDLLTTPGYEPWVDEDQRYSEKPSRHRRAEGWAWVHGDHTLGIFSFCQQNMIFSVVSAEDPATLRFGGACMISGEPAALTRIAPGQTVDLGEIRYETVAGGYTEAEYAYRSMLDEKGCRFPPNFNPPVHWEQLYDMDGAWNDRRHRYTKAIVEREAQKGHDYSCEALYLDPGWDTDFGTFRWGDEWLGPEKDFIAEMTTKYGLAVSLHCPLASWMSHAYSWGLGAVKTWPSEAARKPPPVDAAPLRVPAVRNGRRNLALLPGATASASSLWENGAMPIHQINHLNDGWYGNGASWIAARMPAWAEVDLGAVYRISEVRIGNDHAGEYADRAATDIRIQVASTHDPNSRTPSWQEVARGGEPLLKEQVFDFAPVGARWVRVWIDKAGPDMPRLDEIEVYEADKISAAEAFEETAKRGPEPPAAKGLLGPTLCLGSKQYLDEAEKRLLVHCADGVAFLMFDGNWWNGGCDDPNHGHPVPYTWEDHIRANLDLVRRIHREYPHVIIELHDPIAGGSPARITPVYYKYGLPGSYDDNWGFELMWNPIADLKEGRARALYYYNLGCNV
ncbi:MAG TPA: discoidin domain-containing protein, partial [Fimbriimonadaceae bacterium]|nr:discoidin domain-containing protein [Fimbriimonadaceae bacterium]